MTLIQIITNGVLHSTKSFYDTPRAQLEAFCKILVDRFGEGFVLDLLDNVKESLKNEHEN